MGADDARGATQPAATQPVAEAWHDDSLALGTRLGRYELQRVLGAGGMGVVFEARDPDLDRAVAVKVLRTRAGAAGDTGAARLRREGVTMARLTHPNVIRVYDVGVERGLVFVAMELVRGGTLADWVQRAPRSVDAIVAAFVQAGRGLAAAHDAGLVHRDFKPQNVLVGDDGRVLVTDFGLARELGRNEPGTGSGSGSGSGTDSGTGTGTGTGSGSGSGTDSDSGTDSGSGSGTDSGSGSDGAARSSRPRMAATPGVVTVAGEIVGTPAYMAPEQRASAAVDERADQWSFCVALRAALAGPAAAAASAAMAPTAVGGETTAAATSAAAVPLPAKVPARVRAALARGLEADPARRFPSMHELLAALAPRATPARGWIAAVIGGAALVAGGAWFVLARDRGPADPCPVPDAQIARVWSDARQDALRTRLAGIDPAQGPARLAAAARAVEPMTRDWRAVHVQTCRATRVERMQSDSQFDLRMRCLEGRLTELDGALARVAGAPDAAAVDAAIAALFELTPVERCADERHATRLAALPADRAQRRAVKDLTRAIERLDADRKASALAGLPARADELLAEARRLDHAPSLAAALEAKAEVDLATGAYEPGAAALRELTQVAAGAQDSTTEARAWIALIATTGAKLHRPDEALTLVPAATAAVRRAGEPIDLQVQLLRTEGGILVEGKGVAAGLAKLEQALALLSPDEPDHPGKPSLALAEVLLETGTALMRSRQYDRAIATYERAIAAHRALLGPDSSGEAIARHNLGETYRRAGRPADAVPAFREAARINEARLGASPRLASNLVSIASALGELGQWPEAVTTYERAHAMLRGQVGDADVALVPVLVGLAWTYERVDRIDDAERTYAATLDVVARSGATTVNLPIALYNRGELLRRRGASDAALADFERATIEFEAIGGAAAAYAIYPRVAEGATRVQRGEYDAALAILGAVTSRPAGEIDAVPAAKARVWAARALVESRRDVAGGLAKVRAAREALATAAAADPEGVRDLAEVDAWLAARP